MLTVVSISMFFFLIVSYYHFNIARFYFKFDILQWQFKANEGNKEHLQETTATTTTVLYSSHSAPQGQDDHVHGHSTIYWQQLGEPVITVSARVYVGFGRVDRPRTGVPFPLVQQTRVIQGVPTSQGEKGLHRVVRSHYHLLPILSFSLYSTLYISLYYISLISLKFHFQYY